jgi:ribose-phosphate pyrophosphokinase
MQKGSLRIVCGNASRTLAKEICQQIGTSLIDATVSTFSDGEVNIEIKESVMGQYVFVIQSTSPPTNTHCMELFLLIDALNRAGARKIHVITPYYGYARQDRLTRQTPISASAIAHIIKKMGADSFTSVDLHNKSIQGFFSIPAYNLTALELFADYIKTKNLENITVVSPDSGGTKRARKFAKMVNGQLAIIDKQRPEANISKVSHVVGDVNGRNCIIVDDIVDTAGSLYGAAKALKENGAQKVYAAITHPVLSGNAFEKIANSALEELIVSNSIELKNQPLKIKQVSLAPLLAKDITSIYENNPILELVE